MNQQEKIDQIKEHFESLDELLEGVSEETLDKIIEDIPAPQERGGGEEEEDPDKGTHPPAP